MITKGQTRALFFLDRDTDIEELAERIITQKRNELLPFLERHRDRLNEKEAGEYFTVEDITKLKDNELEKMMRFFRGAVVPYYVRQSRNVWGTESLDSGLVEECTEEIKKAVGFMLYDHTGHITEEVNSLATFQRVKDFNDFLKSVEAVCFDDEGYLFPDSEKYRKTEKLKGREAADRQAYYELREAVKNRHYKREIPK